MLTEGHADGLKTWELERRIQKIEERLDQIVRDLITLKEITESLRRRTDKDEHAPPPRSHRPAWGWHGKRKV